MFVPGSAAEPGIPNGPGNGEEERIGTESIPNTPAEALAVMLMMLKGWKGREGRREMRLMASLTPQQKIG
jgi:hypothetical protein